MSEAKQYKKQIYFNPRTDGNGSSSTHGTSQILTQYQYFLNRPQTKNKKQRYMSSSSSNLRTSDSHGRKVGLRKKLLYKSEMGPRQLYNSNTNTTHYETINHSGERFKTNNSSSNFRSRKTLHRHSKSNTNSVQQIETVNGQQTNKQTDGYSSNMLVKSDASLNFVEEHDIDEQ